MPTLSEAEIATLLTPFLPFPSPDILQKLSTYLELLLKWNARTNLTAIRSPEEIVRRHFGESLFAGLHLAPEADTLLDFGSGAGFPGLPIAILRPEVSVTLGESQNKKSTFLREAVRTLGLKVEVWAARVEAMPEDSIFHTVTLRAVDNMTSALSAAAPHAANDLLLLAGSPPDVPPGFTFHTPISIPTTQSSILLRATRN
jgi:16S rRNA (guanine527-N7)-methyltransferase